MRRSIVVLALACALRSIAGAAPVSSAAAYKVMPWMCLERCGDNITAELAEITAHASQLYAVSYEAFDLGLAADGVTPTLIDNGFTHVGPAIKALGLETYPMITTVDINKLRALFKNPSPFISSTVSALQQRGATGINLDLEPCQDAHPTCDAADGVAYGAFLTTFSNGLHAAGFTVTVDIASWSPFWDFNAIAASTADRLLTMDTYGTWPEFQSGLAKIQAAVASHGGSKRFGAGLCSSCAPLNSTEVSERFALLHQQGVLEVDVWDLPVPQSWYPFF